MADTKYTYTISTAFPTGKVAPDRLTNEIQISAIVTALSKIDVDEVADICDIWFKDALSAEDQTTLNTIVANHSGEPLAPPATEVNLEGARFDKDGKQVIVPTPAPNGSFTWYTSRGDVLDPVGRGAGTEARITYAATETGIKTVELQFAESVYIHDGEINWKPIDEFDGTDYFSVYVKFCQSDDLTPNPGAGNCNITNPPYIDPAPNNDGDYDIDLETACPIPSSSGPWLVNERTEEITVYDEEVGRGKYGTRCMLLTGYTPPPIYLVRNLSMGSPRGIFEIDAYLVEWLSHHWKLGMEVEKVKEPTVEVEINGILMLFRWSSTLNGAV